MTIRTSGKASNPRTAQTPYMSLPTKPNVELCYIQMAISGEEVGDYQVSCGAGLNYASIVDHFINSANRSCGFYCHQHL